MGPQTSSGHLSLLMRLSQQAKKRITVLGEVIKSDDQGEIGLILHKVGSARDALDLTGSQPP